jgi:epoxide hydrolase-like predicted phosphatase
VAQDSSIKNLIFDLGGVILDLSVERTLQSFADISGLKKERVKELFISSKGFLDYEKGEIEDGEFRSFVRDLYSVQTDDDALDASWNAMLLGIPQQKLDLLLSLKEKFNVYLLSNTNNIHLSYINDKIMTPVFGEASLDRYFHKAYYSHHMKKRKPDANIYEQVLDENNLKPHETLFLDDNADNIAGANALGIRTVHVVTPDHIIAYFNGK